MTRLNCLRPSCTQAEIDAVTAVLKSGWWGNGPKCAEFEQRFARLSGYAECVTVDSGTAALHLALTALNIGPGDEVIVPALTFASTALAVLYCGAKPVFVDVDARTLTIDWRDVDAHWNHNTRAVIPVDFAGRPAGDGTQDGYPIIVQDAAQAALGLMYGDLACVSLHPVKNIASTGGGAILTDSGELAARLRRLRWCGIERRMVEAGYAWNYWDYAIDALGYKNDWNDVAAAIALVQLDRAQELLHKRHQVAGWYAELLGDIPGVVLPAPHSRHTWHLYPVRVEAGKRDGIIRRMAERGISCGVHYRPLTHYRVFGQPNTPPVTEREWQRLISLPIYYDLTRDDVERVARELTEAIYA